MHMRKFALDLSLCAVACLSGCATEPPKQLPWSYQGPPGAGYSISLLTVTPTPGTPLVRNVPTTFKVSVAYKLTIANKGLVVLVFQDEHDGHVGGSSARSEVTGPEGTVALEETLQVPQRSKELRLFVPIMPEGVERTTGELTFRYPIVEAQN